jgi:L-fucose isomerase-like protein
VVKPALSTGRYVGSWPKIGIRPAIDGRRNGVRESLEDQTMGLARAAAEFLSANLRYPDGNRSNASSRTTASAASWRRPARPNASAGRA